MREKNEILWAQYKVEPTEALKKEIMMQYANLVHYVIQRTKFGGLTVVDERDFFQFGVEGLSEAVDRFDPDYGTKFETYAIQRIRGKIIDELRKLQSKPKLIGDEDRQAQTVSLNRTFDGEDGYQLYETLPADVESPADVADKNEEKEILLEAIKKLPERDRLIVSLYYYENLSYKEISEILKITVSRISQIHSRIVKELKKHIEAATDDE